MALNKIKLKDAIDKILEKEGAHYRVDEIVTTKFTQDQYEGGACRQRISFKTIEGDKCYFVMLCFYKIKDLNAYINNGFELVLSKNRYASNGYELDVKRITNPFK